MFPWLGGKKLYDIKPMTWWSMRAMSCGWHFWLQNQGGGQWERVVDELWAMSHLVCQRRIISHSNWRKLKDLTAPIQRCRNITHGIISFLISESGNRFPVSAYTWAALMMSRLAFRDADYWTRTGRIFWSSLKVTDYGFLPMEHNNPGDPVPKKSVFKNVVICLSHGLRWNILIGMLVG